jgi:hypothetical protein
VNPTHVDAALDAPAEGYAPPTPAPPPPRIGLKAVLTCVDYGDFLAFTLPTNRLVFDYMVVATTPEDGATQRLCEFWQVHCVTTPDFRKHGPFTKGAGINAALDALRPGPGDFVAHLDADVLLPPMARRMIEAARPDPTFLYGCDRVIVPSFEAWAEFLLAPSLQHENSVFVHPSPFRLGVRVARANEGYIPLGFMQLWCPAATGRTRYPERHGDAARGDELFALQWPRGRRAMLPEVIAYHLESTQGGPMGANWAGRVTPRFGPPAAPRPEKSELHAFSC